MKKTFAGVLLWLLTIQSFAQDSLLRFKVEGQAGYNSHEQLPFWLRSNQFGSIPLVGLSSSFIGSVSKSYHLDKAKLFDWGVGLEGRANLGNEVEFTLIEAYAKLKIAIFQIKAGRSKEITGIVGDSSLTSGSFSISGNALGIPQVSLSIPEYYTLPVFNGIFSIKGNFAHGWLGTESIAENFRLQESKTYFHQTSIYGRIGGPSSRFKVYGGINHQVYWGNYSNIFPESRGRLSRWQEFVKVVTGAGYVDSKVGNHLGSIDFQLEYELPSSILRVYRQNIYDVGAIGKLANLADGLNGIAIINKNSSSTNNFFWSKILIEIFSTKNQAGEIWSRKTATGYENYYNNGQYLKGWSYNNLNLGSPFITSRRFTRESLVSNPTDYFINNRVLAFNFGFEASAKSLFLKTKLSYSKNYGTYRSSGKSHQSLGQIVPANPNLIFNAANQFSVYLEGKKQFKQNILGGVILAGDYGQLYYNSIGIMASVAKSF